MESEKKYTAEDIERLQNARPEDLTPEERRMRNLKPMKAGEPGRRHKGIVHWSTHFKNLMGDEDFLKTIIKTIPANWSGIVGEYPADVLAAGLIASAVREVAKCAAEGRVPDKGTLELIDRIAKIGYGDKLNVETEPSLFDKTQIVFKVVPSAKDSEGNAGRESSENVTGSDNK